MVRNSKKTKKFRFKGLFHPDSPPVKGVDAKVNLSLLKKLAITKEQEDVLKLIEHETIPSVRDAWIEYFYKITERPQCKSN